MTAERFNLAAALLDEQLSAGRGARPALRFEGETLTYADVAGLAAQVGHGLRALGLGPEERVAMLLPDSPQFIATFLGAVRIGAVPVTLSTLLSTEEYAYLLDDCGARALVVHDSVLPKVAPLRPALPRLRHLIVRGAQAPAGAMTFVELTFGRPTAIETEPTVADDMAFWQYSSGTTGRPKAVVHTHRGGVAPAAGHGRHVVGLGAEDRVLSVPKLFFSFGLGNSLLIPFRYGATVILLPDRPDPRRVYELIARERPTVFYNVPTGYAALLAVSPEDVRADLSSIRVCVSAGEPLPAPIFERWRARFGHEILDGIGSTEIGYVAISNVPGDARPGSSGRVIAGYEARVQREDGSACSPGEPGDLLLRGPSAAVFYWRKRDATKHTFRGEWVFTGDRYAVDADGYHTYLGRSDDMLRVSGLWVSPLEVESTLLRHPGVRECAVVSRADADGLVRPCAYVVRNESDQSDDALAAELRSFSASLPPFKRPRWVEFLPELPKTSTGKVQRYRLRS